MFNNTLKIYYAHAMVIYGKPDEKLELKRIKRKFGKAKILNPADYNNHPEKRRDTLGFCFKLIDKSDGVVFSRLLGQVTSGVGAEVNYAIEKGKTVYELCKARFLPVVDPVSYISREATIHLYEKYRELNY